ncbi:MAG: hypothetical protein Q7J25_00445 [Vicinamibacterales bacterium]|nr:hypothetical protein [Vicinamibacterales bacterium]
MGALAILMMLLGAAPAAAQVGSTIDIPTNQRVTLQTPVARLDQASAPKKLWSRWLKGSTHDLYVQVYRFTVTPGQKYTLYGHFKPDGVYRNFYAVGDNPLTDVDYSFGKSGNYTKTFVALAQQPWKENCETVSRRYNLTIAPDSQHPYLYILATSQSPGESIGVKLQSPADSDEDVSGNTNDPACAARKGSTWGQLWRAPFLLQLDPSESAAPAPGATTSRVMDEGDGLPLNQKITLETPATRVEQASAPKKLWSRWAKGQGGDVYISVHHFTLNPGDRYTLYAWFTPDGTYRNLYLSGDNPLTDVDYSFGRSGSYNKGWVVLNQQPWKEACEEVTRRENFSVSPDSNQNHFYLIVLSKTPSQKMSVMMKSPADSDEDVAKSVSDPACAARKGNTWGRLWSYPVLLQLDPSETGGAR